MTGTLPECLTRRTSFISFLLFALALLGSGCQFTTPPGTSTSSAEGTSGALRLRTSPSGARITLDGEAVPDRTPTVLSLLAPGEHEVTLTQPGYFEWDKRILLEAGKTVSVDVLLTPMTTGSISVSSVPFQSLIFIDGKPTPWLTPATIDNLPLGTHTVLLRRDGYEDWSHAIVVVKNRQLQLKASLKPAKGIWGNLNIQTSPSRADIYLDGYPTGNRTPTTLFNLLAGSHTVQLRKKGHVTWNDEVTIREEKTSNLLVTLSRTEPTLSGSAEIGSIPPGAAVTLDGIKVRQHTPAIFESIATGTHTLKVEKPGHLAWEGEFAVRPQERTVLAVTLDYRIHGMLNLLVKSTPSGATVTVDGTVSGQTTPATFDELTPGDHQIVLEKEGYRRWSSPVEVSSNKVSVVQAELVPRGDILKAVVIASGENEIELDARLWRGGEVVDSGEAVVFTVDPPYFGRFSPGKPSVEAGRARTIVSILSPLQKVRLSLTAGNLKTDCILEKGTAGWKITAGEER
jgi:hypothetical protein